MIITAHESILTALRNRDVEESGLPMGEPIDDDACYARRKFSKVFTTIIPWDGTPR